MATSHEVDEQRFVESLADPLNVHTLARRFFSHIANDSASPEGGPNHDAAEESTAFSAYLCYLYRKWAPRAAAFDPRIRYPLAILNLGVLTRDGSGVDPVVASRWFASPEYVAQEWKTLSGFNHIPPLPPPA
jgi:hypothetical protein